MRLKNQLQGRKQRTPKNANWNGLARTESTQVVRISAALFSAVAGAVRKSQRENPQAFCLCNNKAVKEIHRAGSWVKEKEKQLYWHNQSTLNSRSFRYLIRNKVVPSDSSVKTFQTKKKRRCGKTMWHLQPQHHVHDSHVHELELYLSSQHLVFICFFLTQNPTTGRTVQRKQATKSSLLHHMTLSGLACVSAKSCQ